MPLRSSRYRLRRRPPHPRRHPAQESPSAGFLLPLAALMSLLLLLGSLSVQAVSLHGRLRGVSELRQRTREDQLVSAAQQLVARLQRRHACLLPLPLEQWPGADCSSAADLDQLRRGEVFGVGWQLRRWQPATPLQPTTDDTTPSATATTIEQRLSLEIALATQGHETGRRGGFELRLAGPPWRVQELRSVGLRGEGL